MREFHWQHEEIVMKSRRGGLAASDGGVAHGRVIESRPCRKLH